MIIFLLSLLIHCHAQDYLKEVESKKLYSSRQWERLLHLESGLFGKKSEADSDNFFTSKETVDKPKEELINFVKLIINQSTPAGDENIVCRFPARAKWIALELKIPGSYLNFNQCTKYNEYIKKNVKPNQSLSLVFSAYYLESPASAFGHTFFRLKNNDSRHHPQHQTELLDTGLSYAANMATDNALLYAILGIAGGFYGEYTVIPYFYKIREYNDFESRDLWSYDLNLNSQQIDKLMDHLWELGHSQFRYYYFTENCSYELLRLLEVVDPSLHLIDQIPFYIIPVDTLKAVYDSGLVTKVEFRPSTKRKLDFYLTQLNSSEKKILLQEMKKTDFNGEDFKSLNENSKVKVIETLMQYIDFKFSKEVMNQKGNNYERKQKILIYRSNFPIKGLEENIPVPEIESPHKGHGSSRTGLSFGKHQKAGEFFDMNYRFAMHDVLDPRMGQPKHANLEFFDIHLRYLNLQNRLQIRDWTFVDVMTLNPWNAYQKPNSIKANIGLRRKMNNLCQDCLALNSEIGGGVTAVYKNATFFIFGETDWSYSGEFRKNNLEMGLGPSLNLLYAWNDELLSLAQIKYLHFYYGKNDITYYSFETRKHINNKWSFNYLVDIQDSIILNKIGFNFFY